VTEPPRSRGAGAARGAGLDRAAVSDERPKRLSRQAILDAAIALVEERGLAELSMRRLASSLGVQAMSLYPHVPGREDLLDGMVEKVVDELYSDPQVYLEPRHGWEDYLTRIAWGMRRIALGHPRLFPLVATRPPAAPWVRPPLRSLRWVNSFLSGLLDCGFDDRSAAAVYRAFTGFLLGHLLLDVSGRAVDVSAVADSGEGLPAGGGHDGSDEGGQREQAARNPLANYPELQRLREYLSEDNADDEFERSLQNLLERLGELRVRATDDSSVTPAGDPGRIPVAESRD